MRSTGTYARHICPFQTKYGLHTILFIFILACFVFYILKYVGQEDHMLSVGKKTRLLKYSKAVPYEN